MGWNSYGTEGAQPVANVRLAEAAKVVRRGRRFESSEGVGFTSAQLVFPFSRKGRSVAATSTQRPPTSTVRLRTP
jgi:hypothetical protein